MIVTIKKINLMILSVPNLLFKSEKYYTHTRGTGQVEYSQSIQHKSNYNVHEKEGSNKTIENCINLEGQASLCEITKECRLLLKSQFLQ